MAFAAAASFPQLRIQQLPTVPYSNGPGCSAPCPFPLQVRPPTAGMPSSTASGSSRLRELHGTSRCRLHRMVTHVNADTAPLQEEETQSTLSPEEEDEANAREILRVLDILKEKRDMPFNEVRLTLMIEDPWEEERREQFGVENEQGCSREDIAAALVDVYEGRIPSDRVALRELTKEMLFWPNLEDESDAPSNPTQSPYARSTDTGIDPRVAAQRKKVDWDAAVEIQPGKESEDANVPPVVGFSVLYLVSAIPILIGIGVVAILFLNSLR